MRVSSAAQLRQSLHGLALYELRYPSPGRAQLSARSERTMTPRRKERCQTCNALVFAHEMHKHIEQEHMTNGRFEMGATQTDEKLYDGAHGAGWRVREAFAGAYKLEHNGQKPVMSVQNPWMFVAPNDEARFRTRKGALQYHDQRVRRALAAFSRTDSHFDIVENDEADRRVARNRASGQAVWHGARPSSASTHRGSSSTVWSSDVRSVDPFNTVQGARGRARLQAEVGKHARMRPDIVDGEAVPNLPPRAIRVFSAGEDSKLLKSARVTVVDALGVSFERRYHQYKRGSNPRLFWTDLPLSQMSDGECMVHISAGRKYVPQQQRVLKVGTKVRDSVEWLFDLGHGDIEGEWYEEDDDDEEEGSEEGSEEEEGEA